jgi:chemotaxis protein methyltransferase CheR
MTDAKDISGDPRYAPLKRSLIERTGLDYYHGRDGELIRKIESRRRKTGFADCGEYLHFLQTPGGREDWNRLVEDLTIGETYFFRHPEQFDAVREIVLPDLLKRRGNERRLDFWSAGCANGAEPYSLAILLSDSFGGELEGWDVSLLGTDLNRKELETAREGVYGEWSLRTLTPEEIRRMFDPAGSRWKLKERYRKDVRFAYHNLAEEPFLPPGGVSYDLILCRNVLIYFSQAFLSRTLRHLAASLSEGGWLIVGPSENTGDFAPLRRVTHSSGLTIYQKSDPTATETSAFFFDEAALDRLILNPASPPGEKTPEALAEPDAGIEDTLGSLSGGLLFERKEAPTDYAETAEATDRGEIRACIDREDWDRAERSCQALTRDDPLNPKGHYYLSLALEGKGLLEEAERSMRRVIYLNRLSPVAYYHLGRLLQRKGDLEGAIKAYENAAEVADKLNDELPIYEKEEINGEQLKTLTESVLKPLKSRVQAGRSRRKGGR